MFLFFMIFRTLSAVYELDFYISELNKKEKSGFELNLFFQLDLQNIFRIWKKQLEG